MVKAQLLLGVTGGAHCVRLLGAELKLLTGVRGSARGFGDSEGHHGAEIIGFDRI